MKLKRLHLVVVLILLIGCVAALSAQVVSSQTLSIFVTVPPRTTVTVAESGEFTVWSNIEYAQFTMLLSQDVATLHVTAP